eukprot:5177115-Amphidinium_carterae.1
MAHGLRNLWGGVPVGKRSWDIQNDKLFIKSIVCGTYAISKMGCCEVIAEIEASIQKDKDDFQKRIEAACEKE